MRKRKFNNDGIIFTEQNIECEDDLGEDPKREYENGLFMQNHKKCAYFIILTCHA